MGVLDVCVCGSIYYIISIVHRCVPCPDRGAHVLFFLLGSLWHRLLQTQPLARRVELRHISMGHNQRVRVATPTTTATSHLVPSHA